MKNTLQDKIINEIRYDELGEWKYDDLKNFSKKKQLFPYQKEALENFIKALYLYFGELRGDKQRLFNKYLAVGLEEDAFSVCKNVKRKSEQAKVRRRFKLLSEYFAVKNPDALNPCIEGYNFINRMAFWMATGSGKSLVLIKAIEILDYLQRMELIPKREILLLLPREDLIKQFENEVKDFNSYAERKIDFVNLKEKESIQGRLAFGSNIKVYYYRSDLLRHDKKEKILDYRSFDEDGKWYLFLDEAHRGTKDASVAQDIFSILSRNGFLFNFSATFTDKIDLVTTVYNFNLQEFIKHGYGKNIYLSKSYFDFKKGGKRENDEFSEKEKQEQVLKSLITFALVKKSRRNKKLYHAPLLVTLVNSVNTEDSDLLLFFKEIDKIATGNFDEKSFEKVKNELKQEFSEHKEYVFGDEKLNIDLKLIDDLKSKDLFELIFNAQSPGRIEFLEGEKGKELVMKLESAEKPFALIKIGDTSKFKKEKLGIAYNLIKSFETKKYFEHINEKSEINLLIGSRSFYEGWDSNRPNVINMINIGKKDAKKFVLQGIGRGVRIEPRKGERKRLPQNNKDKNVLLETLFVYATDRKSVQAILEEIDNQKSYNEERIIGDLFEQAEPNFDLLIPKFKDLDKQVKDKAKFNIAENTLKRFKTYLNNISDTVLLLRFGLKRTEIEEIKSDSFYQIRLDEEADKYRYENMQYLLAKVINHVKVLAKTVDKIDILKDEIVHFKHIKVRVNTDNGQGLSEEEFESLMKKISEVKAFQGTDIKKLTEEYQQGKISEKELRSKINAKPEAGFKDLKIKKIAKHYYLPIIYATNAKQEYIKHIIDVESEVKFIENLERFSNQNSIGAEWMFSKIAENLDKISIPYYDKETNTYRNFYPDFIFWIKKNDNYKIVFVDPKGTKYTSYESKVDGFERLFLEENKEPRVFLVTIGETKLKVSFDLKLVPEDINTIQGEKYKKYWEFTPSEIFRI